ncbi:TPA: hypothetical protein ACXNHW_006002 [Pseudomonas aeruginosa]
MSKQEWEIVKSDFDTYYVRESEGGHMVERVIAEGICSLDKARLIVAAPELLEALTEAAEILYGIGLLGFSTTALEKSAELKSIIAKATA